MRFFKSDTESQKGDNDDCVNSKSNGADAVIEKVILKIPAITIIYWCEKMTATTFGGKYIFV